MENNNFNFDITIHKDGKRILKLEMNFSGQRFNTALNEFVNKVESLSTISQNMETFSVTLAGQGFSGKNNVALEAQSAGAPKKA